MAVKKADPREEILGQERVMQQDMRRLRANYPENAAYIQCYVEDACDRMDYEGSRMYDEHPYKYMMRKVCDSIHSQIRRGWEWNPVSAEDAATFRTKRCRI